MLKTRLITAFLLIIGMSAAFLYVPSAYLPIVFSVIVLPAAWEWARLCGVVQHRLAVLYALLIAGLFFSFSPLLLKGITALMALFWVLIVPFWLKQRWMLLKNQSAGLFLGMLLLVSAWWSLLYWHTQGIQWLIALMGLVWIADSGAYFVGRQFGKRKLAPLISPGKTWEGVLGGTIGVMLYLIGLTFLGRWGFSSYPLMILLPLGAILTAISIMGDLLESLFKRQIGFKDSSQLLPGHGGVLDRIDSLLAVLPVSAALHFLFQRPISLF